MWGDKVTGGCAQSSIPPDVLIKIYVDIKITWGVLNLRSPYLLWLIKLPAGAAGNCHKTSGTRKPLEINAAYKIWPEISGTWGRSNSPSESQPTSTCKPLRTKAKENSTSKRGRPSGGCETDCDLAPS
jgi:hypothetical protein